MSEIDKVAGNEEPAEQTGQTAGQTGPEKVREIPSEFKSILDSLGITMEELTKPGVLLKSEKGKRFMETEWGMAFAKKFAPQLLPGTREYVMAKILNMGPDDTISTDELALLTQGGASVPIEVTGSAAGTFSAKASEIVHDGRVAMVALEFGSKPGVAPISGEARATMNLNGLGQPAFLQHLQQAFDAIPEVKQYTPAQIVDAIKKSLGVEVSEEAVLEAARSKWDDYDSLHPQAVLPYVLREIFENTPGGLDLLSPAQIISLLRTRNILADDIEVSEEAVFTAAQQKWPEYNGEFKEADFVQIVIKMIPDEAKQKSPEHIAGLIKNQLCVEVSEEAVLAAARDRWEDYDSLHEGEGEGEEEK